MINRSRLLPAMSSLRVERVKVIVEMADGVIHEFESRPGAINQEHGVQVDRDQKIETASLTDNFKDTRLTTTVSWVEQWTEMQR
jgi:hypothetical protein